MKNLVLNTAALLAVPVVAALAQSSGPPKEAIEITNDQIKEVLKYAPPAVDQQLRVVDMGKYNLAVGIVHRGPTGQAAAGRGAGGGGRGAGAAGAGGGGRGGANLERCGESVPASQLPSGPAVSGIAHDDTTETYIITSGTGTLVTGGHIVNGFRSGPDSEVTKILNGPSCSGRMVGDVVSKKVVPGDVIIIPEKVPHGWTDIADHVDYLSVRPDENKVLPAGYVNPHIKGE